MEGSINPHPRMKVSEAALLMNVSPQFLRLGLREGKFPFGTAVKMSSVYTYYINRAELLKYIGKTT